MVGKDGYEFRGWERYVQKKADAIGVAPLAKLISERDEVIVVGPKQIVRPDDLGQLVGKMLVDAEISAEIAPGKLREIDAVMQDRP